MSQRNTLCTHEMLDLQLGQGVGHFHHMLSGKVDDFTNRSMHPMLSATGNTAEQGLLFRDHPDRGRFYGNQFNSFQNFHAVPNIGLNAAAPPNFYTPFTFPSSSSRNFTTSQNNGSSEHLSTAISMDEFGRNNQFVDSIRGIGKKKNAEIPPGNQHNITGSANSSSAPFLSLNCGLPQWEQAYKPAVNQADSTNFEHPEYQDRGNVQTVEGSHQSVRSRPSAFSLQPESAYYPHANYALQAPHMRQPLHPASNVWMAQFGSENNVCNGACSNWNYNHPVANLHGRCLHSGAFELTNMGVRAFPDASSSVNAKVLFNPTSLPNFHQHLSPVQTMQLQSYGHQIQMQAPSYQHPLNSLHPVDVNPSSRGLSPGSRFSHFSPNAAQIFRPRHTHHATLDIIHGSVGILSSEDVAVMDISGFYGVGNVIIDQHQDLRLDIDEMSYEELLALEEQIGDAKIGLTEKFIINNLKTSVHNSQTTTLQSDALSRFSQDSEACIVCQVEYEEDEIVGTLDCGHNYHGECIKQWLLVKNLCPVCKKTGLATVNSEG